MAIPLSRFGGRDNNFNLIRFLAATLVLYSHSFPLSGTPGEPLERVAGFSLGHLGVDVFFVISGFLVTGSLLSKSRLRSFLRARALRIYPALTANAVGCAFLIGPLMTRLGRGAYFGGIEPWRYAAQNATAWPWGVQYTLPGVFERLPVHAVVNGSLWSLPWELTMYAMLSVLGAIAFMRPALLDRRRLTWALVAIAACATLGYAVNETFELSHAFAVVQGLRLTALFFVGAAAYVFRERVPLALPPVLVACVLLALGSVFGRGLMVLYVLTLPYVVFYLAYVPGGLVRRYNALGDYSYGYYLWAFPVQQCVMTFRPGSSQLALSAIAGILTLVLAIASWHLLESPMLALKDRPLAPRSG